MRETHAAELISLLKVGVPAVCYRRTDSVPVWTPMAVCSMEGPNFVLSAALDTDRRILGLWRRAGQPG